MEKNYITYYPKYPIVDGTQAPRNIIVIYLQTHFI